MINIPYSRENYYIYSIKQNNKIRIIEEPCPELKEKQNSYLDLLRNLPWPDYVYGLGSYDKDAIHNALVHYQKPFVLNMDIKKFYPSTTLGTFLLGLDNISRKKLLPLDKYAEIITTFELDYCFIQGKQAALYYLPTGAPTSPFLASLAFLPVDKEISELSKSRGLTYTRYVDDLTFSGDTYPKGFQKDLNKIITQSGYRINSRKTRLCYQTNHSQVITGVLLNYKPVPTKDYRHVLRAELDHYARENKLLDDYILGRLNYLKRLSPNKYISSIQYYQKRRNFYGYETAESI